VTGKCEICDGPLVESLVVPGYQAPNSYVIWDCAECQTMVASPKVVDPRVYDAIYSISGGPPGYDRNFQFAKGVTRTTDPLRYLTTRQDAFWGVCRALQECGARSLLEIGSGLGYFSYALRRAGYDAFGVDVSEKAVAEAEAAFGDFYHAAPIESFASTCQKKFDSIVLVEVIEHLEDPMAVLRSALPLLSPGGAVILTTPNRSFFGADKRWATDLPPVHLWWFSETSIETIAAQIGCTAEIVDFTDYNARFPILSTYQPPLTAMLDSGGCVIRRENPVIAGLRRLGVLQEVYRLASVAAGILPHRRGSRRPTLVAKLKPAD
jgi:SAM-dependent methyltransferase